MGDLAQGQIGPEAKYDVKFEGGKLVAELNYEGALLGAGLNIHIGADQVINAIEKAIPGQIDDAVLELIKSALKVV